MIDVKQKSKQNVDGGTVVLITGEMSITDPHHLARLRCMLKGTDVFASTYNEFRQTAEDLSGSAEHVLLLNRRDVEDGCLVNNRTQWRLLQWLHLNRLLSWLGSVRLLRYNVIVKLRADLFLHDVSFRFARLAASAENVVFALSDLTFYANASIFLTVFGDFFSAATAIYSVDPPLGECSPTVAGWPHRGCKRGGNGSCLTWQFGDPHTGLPRALERFRRVHGNFWSEPAFAYHLHMKHAACRLLADLGPLSMVNAPSAAMEPARDST